VIEETAILPDYLTTSTRDMIYKMLSIQPDDRPTIEELLVWVDREIDGLEVRPKDEEEKEEEGSQPKKQGKISAKSKPIKKTDKKRHVPE